MLQLKLTIKLNTMEEIILKIKNYKTWSIKKKVDALLEMDAIQYTKLGIDSTIAEKKQVKVLSKKIYRAIAYISPIDGHLLRSHMLEIDLTNA